MDERIARREWLNRLSLGLIGLTGVVVSVPLISYLLSPLLRPPPPAWVDVGPADDFQQGQTVLKAIKEVSPLPWAGQTAETAVWVRRVDQQIFIIFEVNCAHLGCPVTWKQEAELFLCPCHGGVYYADGTVAGGPPPRPLFRYENRVQNGTLQVRSRGLGIST